MAYTVRTEGSTQATPPVSSGTQVPSAAYQLPFILSDSYTLVNPSPLKLAAAVDFVINLGMTSCKMILLRTTATVTLKVTTALEAEQVVRCGGFLLLKADTTNPITGLKISGTADGEILICGE